MLNASRGKHSLFIRTLKAKITIVGVCFKAPVNACMLNRLKGGWSCNSVGPNAELTFAAFALYKHISVVLFGTPTAAEASGVTALNCGTSGGHFIMSWQSSHVLSHARKSLGIVLKSLTPARVWPRYQTYCRAFDMKPVRAEFNWAANTLIRGIKGGIGCCIVGKLKVAPKKKTNPKTGARKIVSTRGQVADDFFDICVGKMNVGEAARPQSEPEGHSKCEHDMPSIAASGWEAYVLADFIAFRAPGSDPVIGNREVYVAVSAAKFDTMVAKMRKTASKFIQQKYKRPEMGPFMSMVALAACKVSCGGAKRLCGIDKRDVVSVVTKLLR